MRGLAGDDSLFGLDGDDTLVGGGGTDTSTAEPAPTFCDAIGGESALSCE